MWKLIPEDGQGETYYLIPGEEYVVGRKNCQVLLQNDQSISRVHALLSLGPANSNQNESSTLILKDSSKYGTFVNDKRLENNAPKALRPGDRVTFGVFQSKFRVVHEPLVVCSSCVDNAGKTLLARTVQSLGGRLVSTWTQDCTHLVMPSVKVTIKTISALLCCRPIVKPEFFSELGKALREKRALPRPESFCPEIDEPSLDEKNMDLGSRLERKSLFNGKTFVFFCAKQQKRLSLPLGFGGGRSLLLEEGSLPTSVLDSPRTCVIDMPTGSSQTTQTTSAKAWSDSVARSLQRRGRRLITESEIGLATIFVSTDLYCNPLSQMDTGATGGGAAIPNASLSQSTAVNETVLPATSQNITAYAPDTEKLQDVSRMGSSGLFAVGETPEKQRRRAGSLSNLLVSADQPGTCAVAETVMMMSSPSASAVARKPASPSRTKDDRGVALRPPPASGSKNNSPQKLTNSSLTNYFQPVSKKRTREGSDPPDQSEAKHPRTYTEEGELRSATPTVPHGDPGRTAPTALQSKLCTAPPPPRGERVDLGPSRGGGVAGTLGSDSLRPAANKRKEMAQDALAVDGSLEMSADDLESIMSEPMGDETDHSAAFKRKRLEPLADVKQEEVSFVESKPESAVVSRPESAVVSRPESAVVSRPESTVTPLRQKTEAASVKSETRGPCEAEIGDHVPRNVLVIQFRSLTVDRPPVPRSRARHPQDATGKNFKCFRKMAVPGAMGLPKIIGGSDLVAHNRAKNSELEEWLKEAAEEEDRNKKESLGDDLFRYNPKPAKRR